MSEVDLALPSFIHKSNNERRQEELQEGFTTEYHLLSTNKRNCYYEESTYKFSSSKSNSCTSNISLSPTIGYQSNETSESAPKRKMQEKKDPLNVARDEKKLKQFACLYCGRRFSRKDALKRHEVTRSNDRVCASDGRGKFKNISLKTLQKDVNIIELLWAFVDTPKPLTLNLIFVIVVIVKLYLNYLKLEIVSSCKHVFKMCWKLLGTGTVAGCGPIEERGTVGLPWVDHLVENIGQTLSIRS
ncbi:hypothetical protein HDU92_000037 [Lobulomyces angularis]|nr:hypothetical protein HDU92_000037 [Lobulomyces angularis]